MCKNQFYETNEIMTVKNYSLLYIVTKALFISKSGFTLYP